MSALLELLLKHDGYRMWPDGEVLCKHCDAVMRWSSAAKAGEWSGVVCPTANCPNASGLRVGGKALLGADGLVGDVAATVAMKPGGN
ncbi:MAG TPA: hypothetical protein VHG72_13990 [Polyangia bacterium]|nr:hypothetical protein [Polyangia bacterium]